jgi:predicted glutamine amidotransferase
MFILNGDFRKGKEQILDAMKEVTIADPYSEEVFGKTITHNDGWGYAAYGNNKITHYKSITPYFESEIPDISGEILMLHVRKSGKAGPFGLVNSHPYYRTTATHDIYLAHNGFLGKAELQTGASGEYLQTHSDSEIFLDRMITFSGNVLSMLEQSINFVYENNALKGGINLFVLAVDRKTGKPEIYAYTDAANYKLYHELYFIDFGKYAGIFSSSLIASSHFPEFKEKTTLERHIIYGMNDGKLAGLSEITI